MNGRTAKQITMDALVSADQPDWVCRDCGHQWGLWWDSTGKYKGPVKHCATYHKGKCGVCNQKKTVTEARDYGYLKEGWNQPLLE